MDKIRKDLQVCKYTKSDFIGLKVGQFFRVGYITGPIQKGLYDLCYHVSYSAQACDYEAREKVKEAREAGIMPNCPAAEGEMPTDVKYIYIHKNTGRQKLRVPLASTTTAVKKYYKITAWDDKGKAVKFAEITPEEYYSIWRERGYKIPQPQNRAEWQPPYRSLDIDFIDYLNY